MAALTRFGDMRYGKVRWPWLRSYSVRVSPYKGIPYIGNWTTGEPTRAIYGWATMRLI